MKCNYFWLKALGLLGLFPFSSLPFRKPAKGYLLLERTPNLRKGFLSSL